VRHGNEAANTHVAVHTITLSNVLHIPSVNMCFIAVSVLETKGGEVTFTNGRAKIHIRGKIIASCTRDQKLYWLNAVPISDLNHHYKSGISTWDTCPTQP